jgi:hypothetical protein
MNYALLNTPTGTSPRPAADVLRQGLLLVDELHGKLAFLDDILLIGRPEEITEAAMAVQISLREAEPAFGEIESALHGLMARNFREAAQEWRRVEQGDAAGLAESLRLALSRFGKRSAGASRRARQINSGLNAALRSLHFIGVQESGRLIAEA